MSQDRKYFGMTTTQIAILAGMAVVTCLLFAAAGWMMLQGGFGNAAPAPQDTSTPQPTATPFVIPTITATQTLTPVPYEMLIPEGWVQFKTALVEIWLPKGFKQQKPKPSDNLSDSLTMELEVVQAPSKTLLNTVLVLVSYEPLTAPSLEAYVDALPSQLSTDVSVVAKRKVNVNSVDAMLVVLGMRNNGEEVYDQVYVFLDGSTVWFVQYITQLNQFYDLVPTFEQSIKTFRMVR